ETPLYSCMFLKYNKRKNIATNRPLRFRAVSGALRRSAIYLSPKKSRVWRLNFIESKESDPEAIPASFRPQKRKRSLAPGRTRIQRRLIHLVKGNPGAPGGFRHILVLRCLPDQVLPEKGLLQADGAVRGLHTHQPPLQF